MIGLLETCMSRGMVPVDRITEIALEHRDRHGDKVRKVTFAGGNAFDLRDHEVDELRMRPVQISPTLPGIKYLRMAIGDTVEGSDVAEEPVVAWALCMDGAVRPVTPNGVCGGMWLFEEHHVEMPDGTVHSVGDDLGRESFSSRDAMLRHFIALARLDAKPVGQSELERLIADYVATGKALEATMGQGLEDGNPIEEAYLAATDALDNYQPQTPAEFVRALSARFYEDSPPTEESLKEIFAIAHRLAAESPR